MDGSKTNKNFGATASIRTLKRKRIESPPFSLDYVRTQRFSLAVTVSDISSAWYTIRIILASSIYSYATARPIKPSLTETQQK